MKKILLLIALSLITKFAYTAEGAPQYYIPTSSQTSLNTVNSDITFNNDVTHNADLNMNGFTINNSTRVNTRKLAIGDVPAAQEAVFTDGGVFIEGLTRTTASLGSQADQFGLAMGSLDFGAAPFIFFSTQITASYSTATFILTDTNAPFLNSFLNKKLTIPFSFPTDYIGANADITEIISSTQIRLNFPGGGNKGLIAADIVFYVIADRPIWEVNHGGDTRWTIDENGNFEIIVATAMQSNSFLIESVCHICGHSTVQIKTDVNGCNSVFGILSNFDVSGFDESTDLGIVHNIIIDNVGATGGDVHGIEFSTTDPDNSNIETEALAFRPGIDPIKQYLGIPASLGSGINCVLGVCVDSTTAFGNAGTDVPIFTNQNDTIIIGSNIKFDEINVLLDTVASQTITPTFFYSTGGIRGLTAFSPTDNTVGFTQNGSINFDSDLLTSPIWSTATITEITNGDLIDSSTYYFIEIVRNRAILNPNTPIESQIEVTTLGTDFTWDRNGNIKCNSDAIVDGTTEPDAIPGFAIRYVDIADGDYKIKFGDGTVTTIATD